MTNFREATVYCFKTFACLCKGVSIACVLISIAFLIAGIVMVVQNPIKESSNWFPDDDDDWEKGEWKQPLAISFIAAGIFLLILSICTCCCAFQLGCFKRCLQKKDEPEEQIIREQSEPRNVTDRHQPPHQRPNQLHQPYPQWPQQQPMSHPQLPPNPIPMGDKFPNMPPSYDEVVSGVPSAPPAEEMKL